MSTSVILEGILNHIVKHKAIVEVYAVLTPASLKIYRSQIAFRGNPDAPIKTIDFSNEYVLLPSFEKTHIFTLFRKGEKAFERLYLEASSKDNYDLWLKEIEVQMLAGGRRKEASTLNEDDAPAPKVPPPVTLPTDETDLARKPPMKRDSIKSACPVTERDQPQHSLDRLQMDLKKEKMNVAKETQENKQLKQKVQESEGQIARQEKEIAAKEVQVKELQAKVVFLEKSLQENYEFSNTQLEKAGQDIGGSIHPAEMDLSTYQYLVDYLLSMKMHKTFVDSFLRQQLEHLIHKSPISPNKDLSLFKYLTTSIEMSSDSVVTFVSSFLTTLTTHIGSGISTSSTICESISQMVRSVVELPPTKSSITKSFQQTALEVAYLLRKRGLDQKVLANGYSKPRDIHGEFNELLSSLGLERVNEVLLLELSQHMAEKFRSEASNARSGGGQATEVPLHRPGHTTMTSTQNVVTEHFANVWEKLLSQLTDSQVENNDLRIALRELCARNQELEAAVTRTQYHRNMDKLVNCYTSVSRKLCPSCQVGVSELLDMPVASMLDDLADNFAAYWKSVNDLSVFLAKKKTNNRDVRDAHDLMVKTQQKLEMMVPPLQELTQRTFSPPEAWDQGPKIHQ